MPPERKYSDSEVAFILAQATAADDPNPSVAPSSEGLSLIQLREVAREAGIDPARVERAALAVDRGAVPAVQRRTWLGLPIGVARTIEFGREVTDQEWDQLVIILRETFDARGRLQSDGAFRQWTNGNLQALLERTPTGHRLRLSTLKGDAKLRAGISVMGLAVGGAASSSMLLAGATDVGGLLAMGTLVAVCLWNLASVGFGLPAWARRRAAQMDAIAERVSDGPA